MISYIKKNWILFLVAGASVGGFLYLNYGGSQFCDCATTEKYRDGNTSRSHFRSGSAYRYYHK